MGQSENQPCITFEQLNGKCIPINSCYAYRDRVLTRSKPKICSWNRHEPIVCCPELYKRTVSIPLPSLSLPRPSATLSLGLASDEWKHMKHKLQSNLSECGIRRPFVPLYIVGGGQVQKGQWPWIVSIMRKKLVKFEHICGGSIINKRYILTTAHCLVDALDESELLIGVGSNQLDTSIKIQAEEIIIHSNYSSDSVYNDIGLIKLAKDLIFNELIRPICLPILNSEIDINQLLNSDSEVSTAGWGLDSYGGKSGPNLNEVKVMIVPRVKCNQSYSKLKARTIQKGITEQLLCAGSREDGKDACQGDSGGPLIYRLGQNLEQEWDGKYFQIGIVAFGHRCGDRNFPGVYTNVHYYLNWILKQIADSK